MISLEYTMSGVSFTRVNYPESYTNPECVDLVKTFFKNVDGRNGHRFSVLFNAHTETKFGEIFQTYRDSLYKIHADSGGLQIITQGLEMTPEMKTEIYKTQAKWSDIGMSFDDIPLVVTGGSSKRNDTSSRSFDRVNLDKFARSTGQNLKDQIATFLAEGTVCRPFFIVHGNDLETALRWTEVALKELPDEWIQHIGGIAMGGGSFGNGPKETLLRVIVAGEILNTRADIVHKNIHFLGLGSLTNAFAIVALSKSGYLKPEWHVSYDSTSHSSGHIMGQYIDRHGKLIKLGKSLNRAYQHIYDDINSNFPFYSQAPGMDTFFKTLTTSSSHHTDAGGTMKDILWSNLGCSMSSVVNFTRKISEYCQNYNQFLDERIDMRHQSMYISILNIKTIDDFKRWNQTIGQRFPSKQLRDHSDATVFID